MAKPFDALREPTDWESLIRQYPSGAEYSVDVRKLTQQIIADLDRKLLAHAPTLRVALDQPHETLKEITGLVIFDGTHTHIRPLHLHNCLIHIGGEPLFLARAEAVLALVNAVIDEIVLVTSPDYAKASMHRRVSDTV